MISKYLFLIVNYIIMCLSVKIKWNDYCLDMGWLHPLFLPWIQANAIFCARFTYVFVCRSLMNQLYLQLFRLVVIVL